MGFWDRLNLFDKICAALGAVLAVILILLGVLGLFAGASANFSLPPGLGVLPALVGWGIFKSVVVAWRFSSATRATAEARGFPVGPPSDRL